MALNNPKAGAEFLEALVREAHVFTQRQDLIELLKRATIGIRVVTASLDDVNEQKSLRSALEGAKGSVWRFLAQAANGAYVAGDVSNARQPGGPKLISVALDPRIGAALRALEEIQKLEVIQQDDFELRLLRLAGILVEALWLDSKTGKPGYVVPVLSAPKELRLGHLYTVEEFLAIVEKISPRFRNFDRPPSVKVL
jgi:hypothetical protein